jgi:glycosyltransferase involved in cell wall biosynthesis
MNNWTARKSQRGFPLVSVIIPCYNMAHWLGGAIDSVLAQDYPNLEIIVVDDGSTDNTREVAVAFSQVKYLWRANGGPAAATNMGIENSRGTFIAFIDADDIWLRGKLHAQVKHLIANPDVGLTFTPIQCSDEFGKRLSRNKLISRRPTFRQLLISCTIMPSTVVIRRTCLDTVGLFDPEIKGTDDWDMWLRIACCFRVTEVGRRPLCIYRIHAAALHCDHESMLRMQIKVIRKLHKFTQTRGLQIPRSIFDGAVAVRYLQSGLHWLESGDVRRFESLFREGLSRATSVPAYAWVRILLRVVAISLRRGSVGVHAMRALRHHFVGA